MGGIIMPSHALHRAAHVVPEPSGAAAAARGVERKVAFADVEAPADKKRQACLIDALQEKGLPAPLCRLITDYEEYTPAGPACYPFLLQHRIKQRINSSDKAAITQLAFTGNSLATQARDGKIMTFDCATGIYEGTLKVMPDYDSLEDAFHEEGYIKLTDNEDERGIALTIKIARSFRPPWQESCRDFFALTSEPLTFLTLNYDDTISYHFAMTGPEGAKFMSRAHTLASRVTALTVAVVPQKGLFFVSLPRGIRAYRQKDAVGNVTYEDKKSFHSNQKLPIDCMNATQGGLLATVNRAQELIVQNYEEGKLLVRLMLPSLPSVIKLSEDGTMLAVGYGAGCIELYKLDAADAIADVEKLFKEEAALVEQLAGIERESLAIEEFNAVMGQFTPAMRDRMRNAYEFLVRNWFLRKPAVATGCSCLIQ